LRIGELAALEVGDVRLTQRIGELVIRHRKGDRRRLVPLSPPVRAALRNGWRTASRTGRSRARRVRRCGFRARASRCRALARKIVSAVMERAGIEDSAHGLRHSVATRLFRDHRHDSCSSPKSPATLTSRPRVTMAASAVSTPEREAWNRSLAGAGVAAFDHPAHQQLREALQAVREPLRQLFSSSSYQVAQSVQIASSSGTIGSVQVGLLAEQLLVGAAQRCQARSASSRRSRSGRRCTPFRARWSSRRSGPARTAMS
jgi:hypothetical protein